MDRLRFSFAREDLWMLDKLLFGSVLLLVLWGVACIFSAASGSAGRGVEYAVRQTGWIVVSCTACLFVLGIGYQKFMDWAYPIYGLMLLLLLFTILTAPKIKGSARWLSLGFIRIQPTEFLKISLTLVLAKFLSRYPPLSLKTFLAGIGVALPAIFLLLLQPDAGSALVFLFMTFVCLFVAGTPMKHLFSMMGMGAVLLPFAWMFLKDYQKMRLLVFLDPARDPLGAGYNVIQSRIAVGSGSFWGKGFLQGLQSKLRFLPEPHTDFIFSVYAEEFGFLGSVLLLALFALVFIRCIAGGMKTRDVRGKILVAGFVSWLWFQMFESIGMSMGLMPVTGIPLPFLSYGGSSLLSLLMALGLVGSVCLSTVKPYKKM